MRRRLACAIAAVIFVWTASRASAAPSCSISVTSVNFGTYDVFSTSDTISTGSVSFRCRGSASAITIGLGQGQSGTFSQRTMKKGGESLPYNLFLNAAQTSIWGDGTSGTQVYTNASPPNNTLVTVTIYARIPAGADVSAGAYTDTVAATINF